MKWFFGANQPNQAKYTIVTSSFLTYVKRPRSLSESIVVAGGDFLEIGFFIVRHAMQSQPAFWLGAVAHFGADFV